jgi:exopolyphosphatase/guanosine-5'-triphosphate,3'-diphosphate pyrophosphatase
MLKLSDFWRNRVEEMAAIDLGSNSFHMIVARLEKGELMVLDRIKEPVRLGFGLDADGKLDDLSQRRALECLARFGQRINHLPAHAVRAVGTRTLRKALNAGPFLAKAETALGHSIDVVSGAEEARLIYQGVAQGLDDELDRRLVVDIGGGSTEVIVGEQFQPLHLDSLGMGCVALMRDFFEDGQLSKKSVKKAITFCLQKIEPVHDGFNSVGWQRAIGCSGSIKAISKVAEATTGSPVITRALLKDLCDEAGRSKTVEAFNPNGLTSDRKPVFLGGLIVLRAVFEGLGLESMEASPWALREGLLYDLIGRYDHEDVRSRGVQHLAQRFHTDAEQAKRVSDTALRFFNDNVTSLGLSKPEPWDNYLRWASQVAEVGLDISHNQFHKHSGYIVANCDLAGFSHEEQQRLTFLVRHHRKKPDLNKLTELSEDDQMLIPILLVIFRLATVLHRARTGSTSEGVTLRIEGEQIMLTAQRDWWESHGLTQADLEQEAQYLHKLGFGLLLQQSLTD